MSPPKSTSDDYLNELSAAKIKRSSIKGQITMFHNNLSELNELVPLDSVDFNKLTLKVNKFLELSSKFDQLQSQIEVLNEDNLTDELKERQLIEDKLQTCIATAQNILKLSADSSADDNVQTIATLNHSCCDGHHDGMGFKLPQIKISRFDGSFFRWLEFHDTFLTLIHLNNKIKPIHKFYYLCSYLEGEAARVIQNLEVSNDNYEEAWNILCERYNNKPQLIYNHMNALFTIEPIQRESDKALRFLGDHLSKNLRALKSLGQPTDQWDTIVIHLAVTKLDQATRIKWEEYNNSLTDIPSLNDFKAFLVSRANVLEMLYRSKRDKQPRSLPSFKQNNQFKPETHTKTFTVSADNNQRSCVVCQGKHSVFDCNEFKAMSTEEKWACVVKLKLCHNCLRPDHHVARCRLGGCRVCRRRHNTVLHKHSPNTSQLSTSSSPVETETSGEGQSSSIVMSAVSSSETLLSTAMIDIVNPHTSKVETVRALLDSGSQSSFITNGLRLRLQLTSLPTDITTILGIGDNSFKIIPERCSAQIKSKQSDFTCTHNFLVLPHITSNLPKQYIDLSVFNLPTSLKLADPTFNRPSNVDVLLGADIFWHLLCSEQRSIGPNLPFLHNSKLGWLIAGPLTISRSVKHQVTSCNVATYDYKGLNDNLTKFWDYEDFPDLNKSKEIITECERHFVENTHRLESGRFCVRLPLIDSPDCLGDSFHVAKSRFFNLEKRFRRNPELKGMYSNFIREYHDLGHLSEAPVQKPSISYFLPHHAVFKENSESTKLRVVFDASAQTSSGFSINDLQMIGPNIQDSLFNILLRFRHYKYVLSGDIEKQYRQIVLNELDRDLQIILWREREDLPLRTLRLNTVTYGFASASFLSARCLWQLGEESADPLIRQIIQTDFYCDDLLCGADSESDLLRIKESIVKVLTQGCFNLRKFRSNSAVIINSEVRNTETNALALSSSCHTLGLGWHPSKDSLHFNIDENTPNTITKRTILSTTFKIFDPLGLLTLCTVKPKILLQRLWALKIDWDDPVPVQLRQSWAHFIDNIKYLKLLNVPRNIILDSIAFIELHIFCDASQAAYGTCIYIKSASTSGRQTCNLLCAKSRVAPIKSTTIPRLELCAALLGARLSTTVISALRKPIARSVFWSDSSVVLAWLRSCPTKFKTYIANRVSAIQELTKGSSWHYVPTAHNPADLASRGVDPHQVQSENKWWHGPDYLLEPEENWPSLPNNNKIIDSQELKRSALFVNIDTTTPLIDFDKYSGLKKLQRIMAHVLLFIDKCRKQAPTGQLSLKHLENSLTILIKQAQQQSFSKEITLILSKKSLNPKSTFSSLTPFIDSLGLLRVGGRIRKCNLDYTNKHPLLLSAKHTLTKLIMKYEHIRLLHAGPQLMLSSVRERFWIIGGRDLARRTARKCVTCCRLNAKTMSNIMGDLPSQRLVPDFPFSAVAVDFAGPFLITDRRGRGCKITKCYLCLFICLRFKCIHLEAVSELSKDSFILSLRRFISRRGKPKEIFCDNGRNFVAAAREINDFFKQYSNSIAEFAADQDIHFIFSPAYAPHFNGYAEAGIKSAKFHVKRILGNTHLTFEELSTLFSQVEAILNSRPISPLSSSPNDYAALTPGHFLLGRSLTSLPSPALLDNNPRRLDRFKLLEHMRQHFWQRWQAEYVTELQHRCKWKTRSKDLQEGDLVLIKDDAVPPLLWRLGRVSRLYPGADGVPRVADIKTPKGTIRRALNRLCLLFNDS